jgi:hypothetical protein
MAMQWMATGRKAALSSVAFLSLGGCLILPGEFDSAMTVRKNGDFTFSYKGQIQLIGLANLLNSDFLGDGTKDEFKAVCWNDSIEPASDNNDLKVEIDRDDVASLGREAFSVVPVADWKVQRLTDQVSQDAIDAAGKAADDAGQAAADAAAAAVWELEERECTPAESKELKTEWDRQQAEKKKRDEQGKKMAEMMLGGIDPENPETVKRFTREVERLAAWHKVEHLGNGVFMVDYSTSGRLADDYAFPVIPRYALGEPMIHVTRWDNGRLRVEAPAFRNDPEMSFGALMGMGSMAGGMLGKGSDKMPADPIAIKGSFTLTTDAPILANNSEDGPDVAGTMQVLRWDVGPAAYGAPMALLKLLN